MPRQFRLSDLLGATPAPVQLQILGTREFEVGLITGFAAGKTRGIVAAAIHHAVKYPQAKILLGRKTYAETVNTVKQPFFMMADPLHRAGWFVRPLRWDYREGTNHARLTNGSQFFFSNLDDPVKFRNEEYSMILVDQAEEIPEELWETLTGRIRWPKVPPTAWQAIAAANDRGHNWMWRRFVDLPAKHALNPLACTKDRYCVFFEGHPDEEGVPRLGLPCSTRRFFHGTTLDNQHNLSPRYLSTLLAHPPQWQRHFIYATMEGGSGRLLPDPVVIDHFEPPVHWPKYRAIDHALNSPACCLWFAVNNDGAAHRGIMPGSIYVYREYWADHSSVDQHASRIKILSGREQYAGTVIDRSTFHLTQSRQGGGRVSVADLYAEEGLFCSPSVGDPFARVERIVTAGRRGLTVSRACPHVIEQMPEYEAEQKPDGTYKITAKSSYHSIDALGYGLMIIPNETGDMEIGEERPDYIRNPSPDTATARHNLNEWKRIRAIEEANRDLSSPIDQMIKPFDFWGDPDRDPLEIAGPYDPYGGR